MSTKAPSARPGSWGTIIGSLTTFYDRRWLIKYMAEREVSRGYRGSVLGLVWTFLSPLLMVAVLTVVFSEVVGLRFREVTGDSSLNFGLYLFCGLIPFLAYSQSLSTGANLMRRNSSLVKSVVFPLEILPVSTVVASLVQSVFGVGALMLVLAVLEHRLNWTVVLLPLAIAPQFLFILGLCYLMAVAGVYAPDMRGALGAVVRATFFVTPIIWPASRVPDDWRFIVDYNPLAIMVEAYRALILEGELPDSQGAIYFSLVALALFVVGLVLFNRTKNNLADLL